jgi:TonB family protein
MKVLLALCAAALVVTGCSVKQEVQQSPSQAPVPMLDGRPWPMDAPGHYAQGTVVVFGLVNEGGLMVEACVAQSSGNAALDSAAVQKLVNTRFHPGAKNGVPVSGYVRAPIMLYLDGADHPAPPRSQSVCQTRPVWPNRL